MWKEDVDGWSSRSRGKSRTASGQEEKDGGAFGADPLGVLLTIGRLVQSVPQFLSSFPGVTLVHFPSHRQIFTEEVHRVDRGGKGKRGRRPQWEVAIMDKGTNTNSTSYLALDTQYCIVFCPAFNFCISLQACLHSVLPRIPLSAKIPHGTLTACRLADTERTGLLPADCKRGCNDVVRARSGILRAGIEVVYPICRSTCKSQVTNDEMSSFGGPEFSDPLGISIASCQIHVLP